VQRSGGAIVSTKRDSITHEAHSIQCPVNSYNFKIQFLTLIQVKNAISTWVQFATVAKLWDFEMKMNKEKWAV
jgi:hypothetical protein